MTAIIVKGDPISGVSFYGPFPDGEAAAEWAGEEFRHDADVWWVGGLTSAHDPGKVDESIFDVSVHNSFEADDVYDATRQMVEWLQENAAVTGYRVAHSGSDPDACTFIDAPTAFQAAAPPLSHPWGPV